MELKLAKITLPGRESNPGLPRDRRRYLPLYYRGLVVFCVLILSCVLCVHVEGDVVGTGTSQNGTEFCQPSEA